VGKIFGENGKQFFGRGKRPGAGILTLFINPAAVGRKVYKVSNGTFFGCFFRSADSAQIPS
jgi:hypothetical protein